MLVARTMEEGIELAKRRALKTDRNYSFYLRTLEHGTFRGEVYHCGCIDYVNDSHYDWMTGEGCYQIVCPICQEAWEEAERLV